MLCSYKIRNIAIEPGLVLAPMSGVTSSAFRRLLKRLNPGHLGLVISEFISVEGLTRKSARSVCMMNFHAEERPVAIQIFGHDPIRMRDAALMVQDSGADILDINCGCPAPKVVRKGGGCELMRQPEHLGKILRSVKDAISIPLTMKMRSGWDESSKNAFEIAHIAESEGVESLAVHGRTRAQLYRGQADWSIVEQIAERLTIPVLGSGDVLDRESAEVRLRGKIKGLYIGRGAIANPLIFSSINSAKPQSLSKSTQLVLDILESYILLLREEMPERGIVGKLKQIVSQMCKGYEWRKDICRVMKLDQQLEILALARFENSSALNERAIVCNL